MIKPNGETKKQLLRLEELPLLRQLSFRDGVTLPNPFGHPSSL